MKKNNTFNLKVDVEICQGTAEVTIADPGQEFEELIIDAATLCPTRAITY